MKEYYDSHYSPKGKVKTRRKTDTERVQYPSKNINGHKSGSDNYIKKDKSPIQNKRSDDDTPDGRYRDNKDVTGERPVGDRGSAPPNTPKEQDKKRRIKNIKNQDSQNSPKASPTSNNKPSTSPKTKPNSNDTTKPVTNTPTDDTKPKSGGNKPDTKKPDPKKQASVAKRAWDATKKKTSNVYNKAHDKAGESGKKAGDATGKVVDNTFNRLNKNDHIKK